MPRQRPRGPLQHAACNMQRTTCNGQHATDSVPRANGNRRLSDARKHCCVPRRTRLQEAVRSTRQENLQHAKCNMQAATATRNMRRASHEGASGLADADQQRGSNAVRARAMHRASRRRTMWCMRNAPRRSTRATLTQQCKLRRTACGGRQAGMRHAIACTPAMQGPTVHNSRRCKMPEAAMHGCAQDATRHADVRRLHRGPAVLRMAYLPTWLGRKRVSESIERLAVLQNKTAQDSFVTTPRKNTPHVFPQKRLGAVHSAG
jgi:hypothetical protein